MAQLSDIESFDSLLHDAESPLLLGFYSRAELAADDAFAVLDGSGCFAVSVDTASASELSAALGVRITPTYILIDGGRVIKRTSGRLEADAVRAFCKS